MNTVTEEKTELTLEQFLHNEHEKFLLKCELFAEKRRKLNQENPKGWPLICKKQEWKFAFENMKLEN